MTDLRAPGPATTGSASTIRVPGSAEGLIPQLPSLDGMRGIAVLLVIVYHLGYEHLPGGFLGVEMFFVVSGYLITSLLVAEIDRTGRLDLAGFWARRLRRLVPALLLLLGVLAIVVPIVAADASNQLRSDLPAALLYVTNWWFVVADRSYFDVAGRPELLQHLWSLAIEEQFYLVWPPLVLVLVRWVGRRRWLLPALTATAAMASVVWMAALYDPAADTARVYFGTDTRASALLIGATLAFLWPPDLTKRAFNPPPVLAETAGVVGLATLGWAVLNLNGFDPDVYRGGFLITSIGTALVITAATTPGTLLQPRLSGKVLRWVGLRSYALYLWHWPIIQLSRPDLDVPFDGYRLVLLQLALIFGASEVSWRLVEHPLRRPRTTGWGLAAERYRRARWAVLASVPLMAVVYLVPAGSTSVAGPGPVDAPAPTTTSAPAPAPPAPPILTRGPAPTTSAATQPEDPDREPEDTVPAEGQPEVTGARVLMIGDSVMLGADEELRRRLPEADVDAEVGRQLRVAPDLVADLAEADRLRAVVVIHLGSNGSATAGQLEDLAEVLTAEREVVLVNSTAPRQWTQLVNDRLADLADAHPNVQLVDWHREVSERPDLVGDDGMHLTVAGARRYAELVEAAIHRAG